MQSKYFGIAVKAGVILTAIQISGCTQPGPDTAARKNADEVRQSAPDIEAIGNATFAGIYDQPLTLTGGQWKGEPFAPGGASRPTAGLASDFYLSGDIDDDGREEAIVILWENSGGTGSYSYVAVAGWRDGKVENIGTARIGDRVQIRDAHLDSQHIILQVIQQGPDDAACCPSQKATRTWLLTSDGLQEGGAVIDGTLSSGDLEANSWRLIELGRDEQALPTAPVTLTLDGIRLSGQGPCNRYFAGVEPGDYIGALVISQAGATQMACSAELMDFEQRYFQALSGVNRYSFSMGRLALSWVYDDTWNTMLFEAE